MFFRNELIVVFLVFVVAACSHVPFSLSPEQQEQLSSQSVLPAIDKRLVYVGQVFTLEGDQVFHYQRVVSQKGKLLESSHITYDLNNRPVLVQTALHTPDYKLSEFVSIDLLTGISGFMKSDGNGKQVYQVTRGDRKKIREDTKHHPLVAGPTLFGFILKHWDTLTGGETLSMDFVLADRGEAMAFVIRHEQDTDDSTSTFVIKASNPLFRLFIDPMRVVFNSRTRIPIRYIGRVPPVLEKDGKQIPFDARVEYSYPVTIYR